MADDNVVHLDMETRLDIPVERVLEGAVALGYEKVMVVGWVDDGGGLAMSVQSSTADVPEMLYLLEAAKLRLMRA